MQPNDMDFVAAAVRQKLIGKHCVREFIDLLTRTPPAGPSLTVAHPSESRLQGDIYRSLPFTVLKKDGTAVVRELMCMVLNNTCDLQPERRDSCNIAFAQEYRLYKDFILEKRSLASAKDHFDSIEANKVDGMFYLPECPDTKEGIIVMLGKIATIPANLYEKALADGLRQASLSSLGFYQFLTKMTRFIARVEAEDVSPRQMPAA